MGQRHTSWKWILTILKCKNEVREQSGKKSDDKTGSLVLFSYLLPYLWSLSCQKLCLFCNSNISRNSKAVEAIYIYPSESSRFALLKSGVDYYATIYIL